jgi:hypothetical protein
MFTKEHRTTAHFGEFVIAGHLDSRVTGTVTSWRRNSGGDLGPSQATLQNPCIDGPRMSVGFPDL